MEKCYFRGIGEIRKDKVRELLETSKGISEADFKLYKMIVENYFRGRQKELNASIKIEDDKFLQTNLEFLNGI